MKKILLLLSLGLCVSCLSAQTGLHAKIKTLLQQQHPELVTDNKLIAVYVWQSDDAESRETAKNFEKTYNVYRSARLKGGLKGIIVVAISKENLTPEVVIALGKEGVTNAITLNAEDVKEASGIKNMVFDFYGNEVYHDLEPANIYSSVQNLITR